MPKLTKSAIDIFDEYSAAINKCQRELASQSWFDNGWCINKSFHSRGFTFPTLQSELVQQPIRTGFTLSSGSKKKKSVKSNYQLFCTLRQTLLIGKISG